MLKLQRKKLILCWLFFPLLCSGQNDRLQAAIYKNDLIAMVKNYEPTGDQESRVIDALCANVDFGKYSFEQIAEAHRYARINTVRDILQHELTLKKIEIKRDIADMTLEELIQYAKTYPQRATLTQDVLDNAVATNLNDLTYHELVYLQDVVPNCASAEVNRIVSQRADEKARILSDAASSILSYERKEKATVKYGMERLIWTYFVTAHKELTRAYSTISMVPDAPSQASAQYQQLVKACFNSKYLQSLLQKEVNNYCTQVNAARAEYANFVGKKTYPKFSYTVPAPNFKSSFSNACFNRIAESRRNFIEGRQNVNSASGVVGWLFGGIAGVVTKGLGDLFAIDGLVDAEYESRLKYVQGVHNVLHESCANYCNSVIKDFEKSFANNQKQYEQYLTQQ